MVAKCVNPSCSSTFHSLDRGSLFRIDSDLPRPNSVRLHEYFWLCEDCSENMTVRLDDEAGLKLIYFHDECQPSPDTGSYSWPIDRRDGLLLMRVAFQEGRAGWLPPRSSYLV